LSYWRRREARGRPRGLSGREFTAKEDEAKGPPPASRGVQKPLAQEVRALTAAADRPGTAAVAGRGSERRRLATTESPAVPGAVSDVDATELGKFVTGFEKG